MIQACVNAAVWVRRFELFMVVTARSFFVRVWRHDESLWCCCMYRVVFWWWSKLNLPHRRSIWRTQNLYGKCIRALTKRLTFFLTVSSRKVAMICGECAIWSETRQDHKLWLSTCCPRQCHPIWNKTKRIRLVLGIRVCLWHTTLLSDWRTCSM